MNAITNQRDSVSSKKKPEKTPEPTGSSRVTSSNRTDIPQGKTAFQKRQKSDQKRQDVGRERTRFANRLQKIANQPTPRRDRNIIKTGTKTKPDPQTQKELDNFKPSDMWSVKFNKDKLRIEKWINDNKVEYPKIMLWSGHLYFSRLTGGQAFSISYNIDPELLNSPKITKFTEETSEFHKNNIDNFPEHKKIMEKWISVAAKRHREFEKNVKIRKHHALDLNKYIN